MRLAALLLFCALLMAPSGPAAAHPHAWIDLRSTVILDDSGRVAAIEQEWLFDQFYTLFLTEDLDFTDGEAAAYADLAQTAMKNLRDYDYFTVVRAGGEKIALETVGEAEGELRGGRFWLRFTVPLARPVDPETEAVSYSVYDPTYYIEVLHMKGDLVAFRGTGSGSCLGEIVPPNPDPEFVALAQALDKNAEADSSLGAVFAERVEVSCQ